MNYIEALNWEELAEFTPKDFDMVNGPTNSYSKLRLFDKQEKDVRVTLFRDNHAWCPYCQKVWLWLELKQIPYKVEKVTMNCYGTKETWYKQKLPSGMLPAIELNGYLINESDDILLALENAYGPLGRSLNDPISISLRNLERRIFRAWCLWLCTPGMRSSQEEKLKNNFQQVAHEMGKRLEDCKSKWLDPAFNKSEKSIPGSSDVVFIPYLERMNASLAYYKGFEIRKAHPSIDRWFQSLEKLDVYRGTQGDFHTHSHDLPPQMGGCWENSTTKQKYIAKTIDSGEGLGKQETSWVPPNNQNPELIALYRVIKHHKKLIRLNPMANFDFDQPLRAALTLLILKKASKPVEGSAAGLRYLKDRISVPRDMPLLSARVLRQALEKTAEIDGPESSNPIPTMHRLDQDPKNFI